MATAEFPASYVYDCAVERATDMEQQRLKNRDRCIAKIMKEPIVEGGFWRKTTRFLSAEEAEEKYDRSAAHQYGVYWWEERWYKLRIERVSPLQRIAAAVLKQSGNGLITLTPDDCQALDIPFGFEVAA